MRTSTGRFMAMAALASSMLAGGALPASAQEPDYTLPAGLACEDFGITLDITEANRTTRYFYDKEGEVIRTITAGKGDLLTFTNMTNDNTLVLKTGGSVERVDYGSDGTTTVTYTGHSLQILFPTDFPPGPKSTLSRGRVVFTIEPTDDPDLPLIKMISAKGNALDVCDALA